MFGVVVVFIAVMMTEAGLRSCAGWFQFFFFLYSMHVSEWKQDLAKVEGCADGFGSRVSRVGGGGGR